MVTEFAERLKDILYTRKWYLDKRNGIKRSKKPNGHSLASIRKFKGL